jgi:hypothetical protein
MKKVCVALVSLLLLTVLSYSAGTKSVYEPKTVFFGDVGLAVSDVEGLFLDAGLQYGLSKNLFGEFMVDYYLKPWGSDADGSAFGLNLNGVYKYNLNQSLNLFAKAGVNFTFSKATNDDFGQTISVTSNDFGLNFGGGIEYLLSETMGIRLGGTCKLLFAEDETATWFKFYGGFLYRF